jgi:hypothetical protein
VASEWSHTFGATFIDLKNRWIFFKSDKTKMKTKWNKSYVLWIYGIFSLFPTRKTIWKKYCTLWIGEGMILYLWRGLYRFYSFTNSARNKTREHRAVRNLFNHLFRSRNEAVEITFFLLLRNFGKLNKRKS